MQTDDFGAMEKKKTLLSAHFKLNDLKVINCEANVLMGKSISER